LVPREIKNIIFDLGGVIVDLDFARTFDALARLAGTTPANIEKDATAQPFFHEYEKGRLSDNDFRATLRSYLHSEAPDATLDAAWNAMLLDIAPEKYSLLESLKHKYRTFLLSNTNAIHMTAVNSLVQLGSGHPNLDPYFERTYYSHLLGMRKPDREIYEHVLAENHLVPHETLFLDDLTDNLRGAAALGIQTCLISSPVAVLSLFHESQN